ncbi:xanthine dehydrogenase family protein molybdopterin-binding subunit [Candidatus Palauibacter sp.]|uniref:xanthine dehydrogenase family protein molybdopterin-binding subunit n=1 Tax=Candidatus Palauibacter sp. TaxID=3101350 RepID=UPI003B5A7BEF
MALIGQDISPPDLRAKVTGRARYAEDFRAEGMVFAKLLLSPMPHARVRSVDASRALAMPGVLGILRAAEVNQPDAPGEAALTDEPKYVGEPILALAAVDETTAADAIEAIDIDLEPLPFAIDPLDSLRPGGSNARLEGNIMRLGESGREWEDLKWPQAEFDAAEAEGRLPMGEPTDEWDHGDLDAAFADADYVLEDTIVHQSLTHHPMEPRSSMAYWEDGRCYLYGSTQSTQRAHQAIAGQLDLEPDELVFVGQYCGGGFGSKIAGVPIYQVTALLAKKIQRPVMMRINRYEENYIGRARPGFQAWTKMGFRSDGKITGIDLYIIQDHGPYGRSGDYNTAGAVTDLMYQPDAMRFRGLTLYTNTPPRAAQRAPGGAQIVAMLEPLVDKAARELGIDRVEIRKINAPTHDSEFGPQRITTTSAFVREAIDAGAAQFDWAGKQALSGQRNGTKVTGVGVGLSPYVGGSSGFDGLLLIRPDGTLYIHQGIGNLGTHSMADTARAAADELGLEWDDCAVIWGDSSQHHPYSSVQAGSQTIHAHTRANYAAALDMKRKLQEVAAAALGGSASAYQVGGARVSGPGGSMSFAQAAERAIAMGGEYSGETLPEDINDYTRGSATQLAGQGLMGIARDNFSHEGSTWSWVVGFAVVELDTETGDVRIVDYTGSADCGVVVHPRSLAAQIHGGSVQGFGQARSQKWVFDPKWGVPFAHRLYTARPPGILDVPLSMDWAAAGEPDPQTPIGAKGIGEPPVGAGSAAVTSAIADALGGRCLCRIPLTTDVILAELEGRAQPHALTEIHS